MKKFLYNVKICYLIINFFLIISVFFCKFFKNTFLCLILLFFFCCLYIFSYFFYYFSFKKKVLKKKNEFNFKLKYLDFILHDQDKRYINRANHILKINPFYEEQFNGKIKKIEILYLFSQDIKNEHNKIWIANHDYKLIKKKYYFFDKKLDQFETNVIDFDNALINFFELEEKYKLMFLNIKKNFIEIEKYYNNHNELHFIKEGYQHLFEDIKKYFVEFDKNMDCANYDEVAKIITKLGKIIGEIEKINNIMPELCLLAFKFIPEKISILENEFYNMIKEKYNIRFLIDEKLIFVIKKKLSDIVLNLKKFNYKNLLEDLKNIMNKVNGLLNSLFNEKKARMDLEKINNEIFIYSNDMEKKFINFCNFFSKIQQIYVINESKKNIFYEIKKNFHQNVFLLKRLLDNSIHNNENKIYSDLLLKMINLKKAILDTETKINDFMNYLNSLRNTVENIFDNTLDFYYRLRKVEKKIRDINIAAFHNKYKNKIIQIYNYINDIYSLLNKTPIDVSKLNDLFDINLKIESDSVINQISKEIGLIKLIEKKIVILNRNRAYKEIDNVINQTESFFYNGDIEKSFNIINSFKV